MDHFRIDGDALQQGHRPHVTEDELKTVLPEDRAARAWCAWEDRLGTLSGPIRVHPRSLDPRRRLGFARIVTHYFGNHAFLDDDAIVGHHACLQDNRPICFAGVLDIAAPLRSAWQVAAGVPSATREIVESDAHAAGDDSLDRLVEVLDTFAVRDLIETQRA